MLSRRGFLGAAAVPPFVAATLTSRLSALTPLLAAARQDPRSPAEFARDETFWRAIQQAFPVDRSMSNLNNGGVSPSPSLVHDKLEQRLRFSNDAPPYHMWRILAPGREIVRQRLAAACGCDAEELAITRNASESLMICQHGIELQRGDEVLTTDQDYPRMLQAFRQRERRDGLVCKQVELPVPCVDDDDVVQRFAAAITERTRLILICHVINLTGQILPVQRVCAMAQKRGIPVIVDGAHAIAHFPFRIDEIGCDYYGSSLHKWLFAPIGTGLLYVKKERIPSLWPLFAADAAMDADIRKFEEIGTHPAALGLGIAEALTFHEGIGAERKLARLVMLRDRWAAPLTRLERIRLHTDLSPGRAGAIATVQVQGIETGKLGGFLWDRHRILISPIVHARFEGLRVSPSVYTTLDEIDRFVEVLSDVAKNGLPA
ncbi:MAG TPA: aminotransferase class V-fold PLP-dependent enzyme [Planctomycetota bacterium]|nr:aminotransferase class V-fold PLP-dependent enzyme [Planctomycetota bacterium]